MSRPLRLDFRGALWHITSRGNERREIFRDDNDRHDFLALFAEAVVAYKWIVYAWVLMDNHFHLVVETDEPTVSRGMQWLNARYAGKFNWKYDRVGHVFAGRFKGILVDGETHLVTLARYVAMNPVRAKCVGSVDEWKWTSYHTTAGLPSVAPAVLSNGAYKLLDAFGRNNPARARAGYIDFMHPHGEIESPWTQLRNRIFLGSDEWLAEIQRRIDEEPRSSDHARAERHVVRPTMPEVITAVAETCEMKPEEVMARRGGDARMIAAYLGVYEGVHFRRTIAAALGISSCSRVSSLLRLCRKRIEGDAAFAARVNEAAGKLDHRPPPKPYVLQRTARDLIRSDTLAAPT